LRVSPCPAGPSRYKHGEIMMMMANSFLLGAALADYAMAAECAREASADAKHSRPALEIEEVRLRHAAEQIDLFMSALGDCPFKTALANWNRGRLQRAAAGLAACDAGGLRRLNDNCKRDFDEITDQYLDLYIK
jgi:hypothetical protein